MAAITVQSLSYRYGRTLALDRLDLEVPAGEVYALLGPNGSGKTTLLQLLTGLRPLQGGRATVLGTDVQDLSADDRQRIGYVAEGQRLPAWMSLEQLETYLAPLYPSWDRALSVSLRERFGLDPRRKVRTLSRGEAMKASLLLALAPRPELLFLDEPFTGMDAVVKDELARGVLETAGSHGWTVLLCSHDLAEVETLAERVGLLREGRLLCSEPMDELRDRFRRVEVIAPSGTGAMIPSSARRVERAGNRTSFVVTSAADVRAVEAMRAALPAEARIETHELSLREMFLVLNESPAESAGRVVA
jgi:ABC-2 type transport system ATP-binding protein